MDNQNTITTALETFQTPGGLIVLIILLAFFLLLMILVGIFRLKVTFKPFSIESGWSPNKKRRHNNNSNNSLVEINTEGSVDLNYIVKTLSDICVDYGKNYEKIKKECTEKLNTFSKHNIEIITKQILLDYSELLKNNPAEFPSEKNDDLLRLYLEKDISDVIISALKYFYDDNITQPELENLIERYVKSIMNDLRLRLQNYKFIDSEKLESIYNDSSKYIANLLRDAFKNYSACEEEERNRIEKLLLEHNENIKQQIIRSFCIGEIEHDDNDTSN